MGETRLSPQPEGHSKSVWRVLAPAIPEAQPGGGRAAPGPPTPFSLGAFTPLTLFTSHPKFVASLSMLGAGRDSGDFSLKPDVVAPALGPLMLLPSRRFGE